MNSQERVEQKEIANTPIEENEHSTLTERISDILKIFIIALVSVLILRTFFFQAYQIPTASMENTLLAGDFIIVNKFLYGPSTPEYIPFTSVRIPSFHFPVISKPELNDVVVFRFPGNLDELYSHADINYIKRIIATPKDTLEIIKKNAFVNGEKIPNGENMIFSNRIRSKHEISPRIYPPGKPWNEDNYGPVVIPYKGMNIQLSTKNIEEWRMFINREHGKYVVEVKDEKIYIDAKKIDQYTVKYDYYFTMGDNRDDSMDSRFWGFVREDFIIGEALFIYWSVDPFDEDFFSSIRLSRVFHCIE